MSFVEILKKYQQDIGRSITDEKTINALKKVYEYMQRDITKMYPD